MRERRQNRQQTSPVTDSELNESPDQPAATIKYVPHSTARRRLFQDEEDSEDELNIQHKITRHRRRITRILKPKCNQMYPQHQMRGHQKHYKPENPDNIIQKYKKTVGK